MNVSSSHPGKLWAVWCASWLFLTPAPARATVYGWQSEHGVRSFSNDPENVPQIHRATAQTFTSKLAGKVTSAPVVTPPVNAEADQRSAYEQGLERGLQTAERQVALAGELARTVLTAVPPPPPVRIVIQQAPQTIERHVVLGYDPPFYGFVGPYAPYSSYYRPGYAYGFGYGRFVPHSHFFPGTRGRRQGLFFPHGHFSQDGFLFGHGFVVR